VNDAAAFEPHSRRFIDDHSRAAIASVARPVTTGPDVVDAFVAEWVRRQRSDRRRVG
jgi:hypothetical protein